MGGAPLPRPLPSPPSPQTTKRGALAPTKINNERGILRLLSNSYGLAQFSFQENMKGRVLGLHNKRPGLEHSNKKSL